MTGNLIGLERAKLDISTATTSDERTINALIGACSDAIRKYCRRDFALSRYDEVLDGCRGTRLLLREYPLQAVESVRHCPSVVLEVNNTSSSNQQARVTVTADGLELVRVASGVRTVDTSVTWSANATLQAVATAVNALSGGWSARESSSYTNHPSSDLYLPPTFGDAQQSQGALNCRGCWAGLRLHVAELAGYCWDARGWLYRHDPWMDDTGLASDWSGGPGWWRVQYTAGYAEVPEAVQEACALWVAEQFRLTQRDPGLASLSLVGSTGQTWFHDLIPVRVRGLLAPYRRYTV